MRAAMLHATSVLHVDGNEILVSASAAHVGTSSVDGRGKSDGRKIYERLGCGLKEKIWLSGSAMHVGPSDDGKLEI